MYFLPVGISTTLNSGNNLGASLADTDGRIIHSARCMLGGGGGRGDEGSKDEKINVIHILTFALVL